MRVNKSSQPNIKVSTRTYKAMVRPKEILCMLCSLLFDVNIRFFNPMLPKPTQHSTCHIQHNLNFKRSPTELVPATCLYGFVLHAIRACEPPPHLPRRTFNSTILPPTVIINFLNLGHLLKIVAQQNTIELQALCPVGSAQDQVSTCNRTSYSVSDLDSSAYVTREQTRQTSYQVQDLNATI